MSDIKVNTKQGNLNNNQINQSYTPPEYGKDAFHCPHCHVYAHQSQYPILYNRHNYIENSQILFCVCCRKYSIWIHKQMVYPDLSTAPPAIPEMPEDVKKLYNEARSISNKSPRGACALLRLAIQVLIKTLKEDETNLNKAIQNLVKKGLPEKVGDSLHAVRVVGNNAVHPGKIDIEDNTKVVFSLFKLINFICEKMIKEPKEVDDICNFVNKQETIEKANTINMK